jgi:hypothetical protein
VSAVFERFTERAIKAVMLAQQEAKAAGRSEVRPPLRFRAYVRLVHGRRSACADDWAIPSCTVHPLVQVGTDHLLLGLVVEENSKRGYLNTGLSAERARAAAKELAGPAGSQVSAPTHQSSSERVGGNINVGTTVRSFCVMVTARTA